MAALFGDRPLTMDRCRGLAPQPVAAGPQALSPARDRQWARMPRIGDPFASATWRGGGGAREGGGIIFPHMRCIVADMPPENVVSLFDAEST